MLYFNNYFIMDLPKYIKLTLIATSTALCSLSSFSHNNCGQTLNKNCTDFSLPKPHAMCNSVFLCLSRILVKSNLFINDFYKKIKVLLSTRFNNIIEN